MVRMDEYSDINRATLQTVMNHGMLNEEELKTIFKNLWTKFNPNERMNDNDLTKVIDGINERISRFDQKIIKYQYGLNLMEYYIFCSTAKTSVSKMQNFYSENELEFFKQIFSRIIDNEDLNISPRNALNLQSSTAGKLSKVRAEKLIDTWSTTGYFVRHDNLIFLGPKSLTEFKEDLKSMEVEHLKCCVLCEDIAAWGVTCSTCKTATYHKSCIEKFLARSNKCPSCKAKWTISTDEILRENLR